MPKPIFERRHYQATAAVIASLPLDATPIDIRQAFAKLFEDDNPRFDRERFTNAAKGTP